MSFCLLYDVLAAAHCNTASSQDGGKGDYLHVTRSAGTGPWHFHGPVTCERSTRGSVGVGIGNGWGRSSTGPAVHIDPMRELVEYVVSAQNKSRFVDGLLVFIWLNFSLTEIGLFQVSECATLEDSVIELKGKVEMSELHIQQVCQLLYFFCYCISKR